MPVMTPEGRRQFRQQLQDAADLLDEMLELLRLKESLTVEEFNRKYEFQEEWYHTCIKDDPEFGEGCVCEACLDAKMAVV
jgi:hypothetical protein